MPWMQTISKVLKRLKVLEVTVPFIVVHALKVLEVTIVSIVVHALKVLEVLEVIEASKF